MEEEKQSYIEGDSRHKKMERDIEMLTSNVFIKSSRLIFLS